MKNNYLIIFGFVVGSLGSCKLALSPKASEWFLNKNIREFANIFN
jgi:hypothetical protein